MSKSMLLVALAAVMLVMANASSLKALNDTTPTISSPSNGVCDDFIYTYEDVRTCGAFGDPHIRLFNGTGVNCGYETFVTLIDNEYFKISATAAFVSGSSGNVSSSVTVFTSITFTYKWECNPWSLTFNESGGLNSSVLNHPGAGRHGVRIERNNVFIDAIHLRFQVRMVAGSLVFGLSIPHTLADASHGICTESCPGYEISFANPPIAAPTSGSTVRTAKLAAGVCEDAGLTPGSFEYQACEFDVGLTGNPGIAQASQAFVGVDNEVSTEWVAPGAPPETETPRSSTTPGSDDTPHSTSPDDSPLGAPSNPSGSPSNPSGPPSSPSSTSEPSASSHLAPSFLALMLLAAVYLF